MTAPWPVIGPSLYIFCFRFSSRSIFYGFSLFSQRHLSAVLAPTPSLLWLVRSNLKRQASIRGVFVFGNGGSISPPLCLCACVVLFPLSLSSFIHPPLFYSIFRPVAICGALGPTRPLLDSVRQPTVLLPKLIDNLSFFFFFVLLFSFCFVLQ